MKVTKSNNKRLGCNCDSGLFTEEGVLFLLLEQKIHQEGQVIHSDESGKSGIEVRSPSALN